MRRVSFIVCELCLHKSSLKKRKRKRKERRKRRSRGREREKETEIENHCTLGPVANTQLIGAFKVNSLFYEFIFHNALQKNLNFFSHPSTEQTRRQGQVDKSHYLTKPRLWFRVGSQGAPTWGGPIVRNTEGETQF